MDQGCAYGTRPILMTFDGDRIDVAELTTPRDLHLVIVDLHADYARTPLQVDGFVGCVVKGRRFDIGLPEVYRQTMIDFANA